MEEALDLGGRSWVVDYATICGEASMGDEDLDVWRNIIFFILMLA